MKQEGFLLKGPTQKGGNHSEGCPKWPRKQVLALKKRGSPKNSEKKTRHKGDFPLGFAPSANEKNSAG